MTGPAAVPLLGVPCVVCERPASRVLLYADVHVVEHVAAKPVCRIPVVDGPRAGVRPVTHRRRCERCGRLTAVCKDGSLYPHTVDGQPCQPDHRRLRPIVDVQLPPLDEAVMAS